MIPLQMAMTRDDKLYAANLYNLEGKRTGKSDWCPLSVGITETSGVRG